LVLIASPAFHALMIGNASSWAATRHPHVPVLIVIVRLPPAAAVARRRQPVHVVVGETLRVSDGIRQARFIGISEDRRMTQRIGFGRILARRVGG